MAVWGASTPSIIAMPAATETIAATGRLGRAGLLRMVTSESISCHSGKPVMEYAPNPIGLLPTARETLGSHGGPLHVVGNGITQSGDYRLLYVVMPWSATELVKASPISDTLLHGIDHLSGWSVRKLRSAQLDQDANDCTCWR